MYIFSIIISNQLQKTPKGMETKDVTANEEIDLTFLYPLLISPYVLSIKTIICETSLFFA